MHIYTQKDVFKDDEFIALRKKKENTESLVHTHEFAEFSYVFSGSVNHIIDGKHYEVKRGTVVYIPQGSTHDIEAPASFSCVEIFVKTEIADALFSSMKKGGNVSEELFKEKCLPYFFAEFKGDDRSRIESIIQDMLLEYNYQIMNSQNVLYSYFQILIALMIRNRLIEAQNLKVIPVDVMNHIDIHYKRQLKVEELASRSFYSTKYFSHIFKKSTGVSLTDYIAKKRIDEGCRLLIETDMTIDEISKNLGWENNTQFYNNFKKYCGVTPHTYKKKQR